MVTLNEDDISDYDCFKFSVEQGEDYYIEISSDYDFKSKLSCDEYSCTFCIYANSGTFYECGSSGNCYLILSAYYYNVDYRVRVSSVDNYMDNICEYVGNSNIDEALTFVEQSLGSDPDNEELNLYAAILRIVNVIENPDSELENLEDLFGVIFHVFPVIDFRAPDPLPESAPDISQLQTYAVNNFFTGD